MKKKIFFKEVIKKSLNCFDLKFPYLILCNINSTMYLEESCDKSMAINVRATYFVNFESLPDSELGR